jgi:hypothetical protein
VKGRRQLFVLGKVQRIRKSKSISIHSKSTMPFMIDKGAGHLIQILDMVDQPVFGGSLQHHTGRLK